ncbi:MAG: hypothetical protein ACJA1L_000167 [Paracoccaceae bacterium]|jgi:hypothetical protein
MRSKAFSRLAQRVRPRLVHHLAACLVITLLLGCSGAPRFVGSAGPPRPIVESISLSRDGTRAAAVLSGPNRGRWGRQLIVLDLPRGRATTEPTDGLVISAAISPDGGRLAWAAKTNAVDKPQFLGTGIYMRDLAGGARRTLVPPLSSSDHIFLNDAGDAVQHNQSPVSRGALHFSNDGAAIRYSRGQSFQFDPSRIINFTLRSVDVASGRDVSRFPDMPPVVATSNGGARRWVGDGTLIKASTVFPFDRNPRPKLRPSIYALDARGRLAWELKVPFPGLPSDIWVQDIAGSADNESFVINSGDAVYHVMGGVAKRIGEKEAWKMAAIERLALSGDGRTLLVAGLAAKRSAGGASPLVRVNLNTLEWASVALPGVGR